MFSFIIIKYIRKYIKDYTKSISPMWRLSFKTYAVD